MKMIKVTRPADDGESPYLSARREWNERYGEYIARAENWKRAAYAALFICAVQAVGLVWVSSQSKDIPYVIAVDKLGDVVAVGRADRATKADPRVAKAQVAWWVATARSVTSDPFAEKSAMEQVYNFVGGGATELLNTYYRAHPPFGQRHTVAVSIDSILPESDNTYEVQWSEIERDSLGREIATTHWVAQLTLAFDPPSTEKGIIANPLGLLITNITWTQHI